MASLVEIFESREGESNGAFGDTFVSRLFQVTVDDQDDEPHTVIQSIRPGGIPLGSLHPKAARNGIVALMFTRGRRINTLTWSVIVHYGPPIFFPVEQSYWEIAIRGNGEQEFVFHDLDGKPIGVPRYLPIDVGVSPADSPLFYTRTQDENGDTIDQPLRMPDHDNPHKRQMFLQGATRFKRGGDVLLQRNFAKFPQPIDTVLAAIRTVNNDKVRVRIADFATDITLGPPRHFTLANADIHPMPGVLVGQIIPNRIWQVTIQLQYSAIPWNPYTLQHTFRSGATETRVVRSDGTNPIDEGVTDDFRLNETANFTTLLGLFESGSGGALTTQGRVKP